MCSSSRTRIRATPPAPRAALHQPPHLRHKARAPQDESTPPGACRLGLLMPFLGGKRLLGAGAEIICHSVLLAGEDRRAAASTPR